MVSSPTARIIAVALPEITFVPMNAKDSAPPRPPLPVMAPGLPSLPVPPSPPCRPLRRCPICPAVPPAPPVPRSPPMPLLALPPRPPLPVMAPGLPSLPVPPSPPCRPLRRCPIWTAVIFQLTFLVGLLGLCLVTPDGQRFIYLVFEVVSALATVGVTANVTSTLNGATAVIFQLTFLVGLLGLCLVTPDGQRFIYLVFEVGAHCTWGSALIVWQQAKPARTRTLPPSSTNRPTLDHQTKPVHGANVADVAKPRRTMNRPGMSGDSSSWKGWGHVRWFIEEVPAGAA